MVKADNKLAAEQGMGLAEDSQAGLPVGGQSVVKANKLTRMPSKCMGLAAVRQVEFPVQGDIEKDQDASEHGNDTGRSRHRTGLRKSFGMNLATPAELLQANGWTNQGTRGATKTVGNEGVVESSGGECDARSCYVRDGTRTKYPAPVFIVGTWHIASGPR